MIENHHSLFDGIRPSVLLFDVDGTLSDQSEDMRKLLLINASIKASACLGLRDPSMAFEYITEAKQAGIGVSQFLAQIGDKNPHGIHPSLKTEYEELVETTFPYDPELTNYLKKLSSIGFALYVLSNGSPYETRTKLMSLFGVPDSVTGASSCEARFSPDYKVGIGPVRGIISPSCVGLHKPDIKAFLYALDHVDMADSPGSVVMIGDQGADMKASRVGIRTVWMNRGYKHRIEGESLNSIDFMVGDIGSLYQLLAGNQIVLRDPRFYVESPERMYAGQL